MYALFHLGNILFGFVLSYSNNTFVAIRLDILMILLFVMKNLNKSLIQFIQRTKY